MKVRATIYRTSKKIKGGSMTYYSDVDRLINKISPAEFTIGLLNRCFNSVKFPRREQKQVYSNKDINRLAKEKGDADQYNYFEETVRIARDHAEAIAEDHAEIFGLAVSPKPNRKVNR
jgi:hypothetical protein